jgi:hypothetical protein
MVEFLLTNIETSGPYEKPKIGIDCFSLSRCHSQVQLNQFSCILRNRQIRTSLTLRQFGRMTGVGRCYFHLRRSHYRQYYL